MAQVKERGGGGEERKETVSFLRLLFPHLLFFGSRFISRAVKTENLLPWCFFASKTGGPGSGVPRLVRDSFFPG